MRCYFCIQVNKKDKTELRTLTITPSENTHFRVILSKEAMEEESRQSEGTSDPVCGIIKPEPRTITCDEDSHLQPPDASTHNTNFPDHELDFSKSAPGSFSSEQRPPNSELSKKSLRKTRWTSSPPSRKDKDSAGSGGSSRTGHETAVCPDSRTTTKASDSPSKRKSNVNFLYSILWGCVFHCLYITEGNSNCFD